MSYGVRYLEYSRKKGVPLWESTLNPVIEEVMKNESWMILFRQGGSTRGNFSNLTRVLAMPVQPESNFWTRNFLLSCLARNLTVHNYPTEDWFYGDLFGEMLRAIIYSFLYSWHVAKREHWV